jgi:hypothetical protein
MFRSDIPTKISVNREKMISKHGGVGIKMNFACDIFEKLEQLSDDVKAWRDGNSTFTKEKEYYNYIFNLDIFIFELYSILEYFALDMGEILKLKKKLKNKTVEIEYFTDLHKALNLDPKIRQKVNVFERQSWFKYFHEMRNRITHRMPISLRALVYGKTIEFPFLPDDPLDPQSVSLKKLDPLTECKKWLEGVFKFIDDICVDLGRELFDTF